MCTKLNTQPVDNPCIFRPALGASETGTTCREPEWVLENHIATWKYHRRALLFAWESTPRAGPVPEKNPGCFSSWLATSASFPSCLCFSFPPLPFFFSFSSSSNCHQKELLLLQSMYAISHANKPLCLSLSPHPLGSIGKSVLLSFSQQKRC